MDEKTLQAAVIQLAQWRKWRVVHFMPAQNARGDWRTPVAADGKGYPDLTMIRGGRIVVAELKSVRGRTTTEQELWLAAWLLTDAEVFLWYPKDWLEGTIERVLR